MAELCSLLALRVPSGGGHALQLLKCGLLTTSVTALFICYVFPRLTAGALRSPANAGAWKCLFPPHFCPFLLPDCIIYCQVHMYLCLFPDGLTLSMF